jgi:hypothetical protein
MKHLACALALGAAGNALVSTAALASEQSYRIDSSSETTINLDVCSASVHLQADGDNDTDLDFWLYDNFGNQIHSDTDTTDLTFFTINNSAAGGGRCLPYRLRVQNLGNVYNNMVLTLTDQGGGSGQTSITPDSGNAGRVTTQSVRSDANSNSSYSLNLCAPSVYLEVRGDGDTDLDFWVTDPSGNEVHADTDSTDITFATLNTGRAYGSCATYRLRIRNYGDVYNQVEIKLTDQ